MSLNNNQEKDNQAECYHQIYVLLLFQIYIHKVPF